jgi:hypothetical protein
MRQRHFLRAFTVTAALALAACGGGALLVLGFIGSAGGSWLQDDNPAQPGLQVRSTCGPGRNENCFINIQPVGGQNLFAERFAITFTSNLPGICSAGGDGNVDGRRLFLTGCFSGEYVNINQALSDNDAVRMFFDFTPPLNQGIWVELNKGQRSFAFIDNATGCELGPPKTAVTVVLSPSNILNAAGPFETTIQSFTIADQGGPWSGKFVGVSGMRLTRGDDVLELERRQGSTGC